MKKILPTLVIPFLLLLAHCGSADEDRSFGGGASGGTTATPAPTATPTPGGTTPPPPAPTPTQSNVSSARISSFIWKPASERNNNLVVLVNPTNVRIVVTGSLSETLANSGPSNGFGTTGRGSFSGCSYGNNVRVEFFDSRGLRILTNGGRTSLSIPRGCDRFEF